MSEDKKYYWLKLKDNYFDDPKIKIIEEMENGKDYIIFLLKLKLKSVQENGYLRVTENIPYDEKSLAVITNTNIDIVRQAIKVFIEFKFVEIMDDGTLYLKCIENLIGSKTAVADRVAKHREKTKLLHGNKMKQICNPELELDIELDIEKEKEKDIEKEKKKEGFKKPTLSELQEYTRTRPTPIDCESFLDFYASKGWYVGKNKMKNWRAAVRTWERRQQPVETERERKAREYLENWRKEDELSRAGEQVQP